MDNGNLLPQLSEAAPVSIAEKQPANSQPNGDPWLKPYEFRKGVSGNPNGRPKNASLTAALRRRLEEGNTLQELAHHLVELAKGKGTVAVQAMNIILERTEGDVKRSFEMAFRLQNRDYDNLSTPQLLELLDYHQKRLAEQGPVVVTE